jgi:hypothetical protein
LVHSNLAYPYGPFLPERSIWEKIKALYEGHEMVFDPLRIHGWTHVYRCCFAAWHLRRLFPRLYSFSAADEVWLVVVALHDVGRENNGTDVWENKSTRICSDFLKSNFKLSIGEAEVISACINGSEPEKYRGLRLLLCDADTLDYSRFGPKAMFKPEHLNCVKALGPEVLPEIEKLLDRVMSLQTIEIEGYIRHETDLQ